ncbi:ABC transporter permease [Rubellimicrobium sp. CFH 75288]|uniref:ABC transporter permease n=1 Tax=Rubellimicrobium sp. CFH 75288 TaxID=2697034 RepID=UPI0014120F43|nr:ABC transporter permease [Rubellimicrobium sp. CFH 75288]NAZ37708.1 ABC transporter permease [Rubellimicrobium sp. CFH 75288]
MTDSSALARPPAGLRWKALIRQREVAILLLILIVGAVASVLSPFFLTWANLSNVLIACSVEMIVAAGLAIVLISGGIDLSVGSIMGVCAIALAIVLDAGAPLWAALSVCLLAGLAFGVANGTLIAYAGLNPLVLTLATMTIGRSVVFILSQGYSFASIPQGFKSAFNATPLFGLPNLVWVSLGVTAALGVLLQRNVWFRRFYFLGGSEVAAIRAGIDTRRLKFMAYVIAALLATLAAIVTTARLGSAFPNTGSGLELRVITAAVIGGCSIYGGKGTILGAALGVLLLNLINNVLVILSLSVYWQGVAAGLILILAILTDIANRRGVRR